METSRKTPYQTPTSTTIEVRTAGIICQSGGLEDYNHGTDQNW